jgi:mono/diheme cytochrome c family protein/plastocyanin
VGSVQKLATVVIIGLVGFATLLIIYLADESFRQDSRAATQHELAIERGTELYITYCLQCHGPAGNGATEQGEEPQRIGADLNSERYLTDDPAVLQEAEDRIRLRLANGAPADAEDDRKLMPAFGDELNSEQVDDLVTMILSGSWDYVYNESVLTTGETVALETCAATPTPDEPFCENIEEAPPVYPTAPPQETPEEEQQAQAPTDAQAAATLDAQDPFAWSTNELTLRPGDTIQVTNVGMAQHDFSVDEFGLNENLPPGEPVMITIPADAQPGQYEFYCSVPGHAESGMVGTLTIQG